MLSSQFIEHFHFLRPAWGLLLLPILIILLQQRRQGNETRGWGAIIAPHLLEALRVRQFQNHWFNPATAGVVFMLLMTLVLMGPSWRQQPSPLTRDEAALVILLDVSDSMQQQDIQPSRLARARQKISDLLELRTGSQTSLVVYSGTAHTVLTLTNDREILSQYLKAIKPGIMPRSGKFAEYALQLVDGIVGTSLAPTTVLLVSDGISDSSESAFANYFETSPHQLLVWGIGQPPDQAGEGIAPLDEKALRRLAAAGDGRYQALSIDKSDVQALHRRINSHYVVMADQAVPWLDSGYWLLFPGMALFSLWFRRGWTLQWSLAGILLLGSLQPQVARAEGNHWFADLWLTPDQQGRILFQQEQYAQAAARFSDPMWKGMAWYYAEDFKLAAEYFSRVDSEAARFNRANALAHGQHYVLAVRLYNRLLRDNPEFAAALHNRDQVQEIIDAINRMSESQQDDRPGGDASKELGDDDPRRADGAERETASAEELVQFSAEEILQDPKINEMWLRAVQRDPSHFLAVKFSMQLEQREQPQ